MPEELWQIISDFPTYSISSLGRIFNNETQEFVGCSSNNHGHIRVNLFQDGTRERHTRSVALLVAEAFVEAPDEKCDHVILLDGELHNVAAQNLAWRPPRFAWLYTHQLRVLARSYYENLAVLNCTTRKHYKSVIHCGMKEGLLFNDIWKSTYTGDSIYPYWHVFRITTRV